ncbi:MAG: AAA family ATPase [Candidatus Paceibacterota bacterium]|jgi:DNA polymerase-3 subunit gamma/tau
MSRDESLNLYLKYRPDCFDEFVGNEATVQSLKSVVVRDKGEVRAFLFTGPSGCGKTTLARITAKEMGCHETCFYEYNIANLRGIDTIREMASSLTYLPMVGKVKVYLLDETQKMTGDAQSALLKILEDTPKHVRFLLCTTDPDKLLKTIRTRCTTFHVSSLQRSKIMKLLKWVCEQEKVAIGLPVLQKIAEYCDGGPRQALVMLDQIIDIEDENIALQAVLDTTVGEANVLELCQKLLSPGCQWKTLSGILKNIDDEPEKVRYAILSYMTKVLLNDKPSDRIPQIIDLFTDTFIYSGKAGLVMNCFLSTKL